ncbi:MAG: GNAT family N-acetyltransferase [Oscillospiraceae bacterium]
MLFCRLPLWYNNSEVKIMELIHENNRIYCLNPNGQIIAEITFPSVDKDTVDISRTFVDPSLRGQGVAETLIRAAIEDIRSKNLKIVPTCSYAVKWFTTHPELSDLLKARPQS